MQVEISAGNPNFRLPQVTRGKISDPAGKLSEASSFRVMVELFKLIHVSLDVVPNKLTKIIACSH